MSKTVRFIGDIHGKMLPYLRLLEGVENSVQIGDFGLGFGTLGEPDYIDEMLDDMPGSHRYIRGNHDSPEHCRRSSHWIHDGLVEGPIMYMGGAASIDRDFRIEGESWWADEELSMQRLQDMIYLYDMRKPNILVTHDCTEEFAQNYMMPAVRSRLNFRSRTRDAISAMYAMRKPDIHIFGHWHIKVDIVDPATGVRMICLPELGHIDLEIDE